MIFFAILLLIIVILCVNVYVKRDPITRKKVSVTSRFSKLFCEPGTEFQLKTEIDNASSHSMRRVYLRQNMHEAFIITDQKKHKEIRFKSGEKQLICKTNVRAKKKKEISINLTVERRGVYGSNELQLDCVDFLGFHSAYYNKKINNRIIIAPKKVDDGFLSSLITSGYGDFNAKRGFIEDEMSVSTYAEYTGREPMRQISWKKSAQMGNLIVKKYEAMGAHVTTIVFDVDGFRDAKYGSKNYYQIEYAISMLRAIFEYFEKKRIAYRMYTNAKASAIENHVFTSVPSGKKTKLRMLSMLGELDYSGKNSVAMSSKSLLDFAVKNSYKGPFVYLAPINKSLVNLNLKKISKAKGMEIIELYSEKYCNEKTLKNKEVVQ